MKDYYSILGVSRNATEEEIKQAFRRQAMRHHPDRGGDSVLFQDINEAYSVLSDSQKRTAYDNPHQFRNININMNGGQFDLDEIFNMFGARVQQQRRPATARMTLWISLEDIARGGKRPVAISSPGGQQTIEIEIPPALQDGDTLRYAKIGPGDSDLVITYRIKPDPHWQRQDLNLIRNLDIDIWTLLVGGTAQVNDILGSWLELTIPPMTQPGTLMRARGRGLKKNAHQGDMLIRIQARLPEHVPENILEQIRNMRGQ